MPRNRPSGIPPVHVMDLGGSNVVTFTGNARFGFATDTTVIFSPCAIVPSRRTTPESHVV
ncbi:MAG: hypothetical protein ACXWXQ_07705 [Actinomycetota bacterium]